jgi:hypothetical protein
MVRHTGSEELLRALDVEIVDDLDDELAAAARQWLADVRRANGTLSPVAADHDVGGTRRAAFLRQAKGPG